MIRINAMGEACPLPVVKTLRALQSLGGAGSVETLVDNETAVQNLRRLAESKGCSIEVETISDAEYRVTITAAEGAELPKEEAIACTARRRRKRPSSSSRPTTWARGTRSSAELCSRRSCSRSRSRRRCPRRSCFTTPARPSPAKARPRSRTCRRCRARASRS